MAWILSGSKISVSKNFGPGYLRYFFTISEDAENTMKELIRPVKVIRLHPKEMLRNIKFYKLKVKEGQQVRVGEPLV